MAITTQKFKGDPRELQFEASATPAFERTSQALDAFFQEGYDATPWLLMLYDENRMPFSERINRIAFVDFIKESLKRFPSTGTFDSYLFVLRAIFGVDSDINFEVPAPGKLSIDVNAASSLTFLFIAKEVSGTTALTFQMIDHLGNQLAFRGIAGIETEGELELLFSEMIPVGIYPTITLTFFERSTFIAEDDGGLIYSIVTFSGDQIIFWEPGG